MHYNESAEVSRQSEPLLVNTQSTSHEAEYQEYVQRWFMLAVIVVLNLSNGMVFLYFIFLLIPMIASVLPLTNLCFNFKHRQSVIAHFLLPLRMYGTVCCRHHCCF